jgi:uncharacterized protein (TIGR02270 family)
MPDIIPEIVEQHAEEAAFLWLLRDAAVCAPHYLLADLVRLDNRVEAHLEGLRLAGDAGWEICENAMGDAGEVFAAAVLALENGQPGRLQVALAKGGATPETQRGLISALAWLPYDKAEPHLKRLLTADDAASQRIGIAASAAHRKHAGKALVDALASKEAPLQSRAFRAVGELGLVTSHTALRKGFSADDVTSRFWANWSAALLVSDRDAVANLQTLVEAKAPHHLRAVQVVMRRLEVRAARKWHDRLGGDPKLLRPAIIGAGAIGDPELVPWLISQMNAPPLARIAGEAFSMITGVHIAYQKLETSKPEGFEAGPTEDPEDEDVAMDPDDNLPWPDPEKIAKWWAANQGNFAKGTRHLRGKPLTPDWLRQVLREGYQRQRAAAALELAILQPEKGLYEVRAPGFRQR